MASTDKIHLNLDTAEREQEFETFAVNIGDRRIEITDPAEIDWNDLMNCDSPVEFWKYTMKQEDRDYLAAQKLKSWRIALLLEKYLAHYKAEERVDARKKLGF